MSDGVIGFDELINSFNNIINNYDNKAIEFMKNIELETVANTQLNSPVLKGDLRRSWTFEEPIKKDNAIIGEIGSDPAIAPHAELVEHGHATKSGGWVGGQFILKKEVEKINFQDKVNEFHKNLTDGVGL